MGCNETRLEQVSGPTEPLMQTTFSEQNGELSPDGHWLAYQSNESGQDQVSVRPFPITLTGDASRLRF